MSKKLCKECKSKPVDPTSKLGFCLECRREFYKKRALRVKIESSENEWF